jgi:hypothetical protein
LLCQIKISRCPSLSLMFIFSKKVFLGKTKANPYLSLLSLFGLGAELKKMNSNNRVISI